MFVSLLRSLMANYHVNGGILQDVELLALSDSLLKDAQCSSASCIFTVNFTSRTTEEGRKRLEQIIILSDLQLGIEQPYIFWIVDLQSDSNECILNWSTTKLLLCLVCAHLLDATTFGITLIELCVIGGMGIVQDILTTPLSTSAAPFLSIYVYSIALLCLLIGFNRGYGEPFNACVSSLESLKSDACAFAIHRAVSSVNPQLSSTDSAALARLLTISDTLHVLLTCRRVHRLADTNVLSCEFSDVRAVTDKINSLITIELHSATALVTLFSTCITQDRLVTLVSNRGSHFCHLAADLTLPNQVKGQQLGIVSEVSKDILDTLYTRTTLERLSAFTHRVYMKAYKRLVLIHVVFAYFDDWLHMDYGKMCAELIHSYSSSPSSLQHNVCLCAEASGLAALPLLSLTCYLATCVHALDYAWRSFKTGPSSVPNATHQNNILVTDIIIHIAHASKHHSKLMHLMLQDLQVGTSQHALLKQAVNAYCKLMQILMEFLSDPVDSSTITMNELCPELLSTKLLHTILSGIQSLYILHCLENKLSAPTPINSEECCTHDLSSLSVTHTLVPLATQVLLLLLRQHLHLSNAASLQQHDSSTKSKLFACCFAFLFSLDTVFSTNRKGYVVIDFNEEHKDLLRSLLPVTVSAVETLLISLLPFIIISFVPGTSVPSDFISLYLKQISQFYDSNPRIQSYYKLICRIADSCHTVVALNQSAHVSRYMLAYIFFQYFLVQVCGERYHLVTTTIRELCMKEICEQSNIAFCLFSSTYLPSLTANLYLPLSYTAPSERLALLCIESRTPIMMNYPRLSVEDFVAVTGALAILSSVENAIASALAYHASPENLSLSDAILHDALVVAIIFLTVLYADTEALAGAKTLKKVELMTSSIKAIKELIVLPIFANTKPHKLFFEGIESYNGVTAHIFRLLSVIFILMTALFPLSKDVLHRVRLLSTLLSIKQRGSMPVEMPISIFANLSNYTGFLFRIVSLRHMKPLLSSICYRETYIDDESKALDVVALWNRLKTMYLHVIVYGIHSPIILESLLDHFGILFYAVSTLVPGFLYTQLAVDMFLTLEEVIDAGQDNSIFTIYWLGYIRMLLEYNSGTLTQLVELIIDGRRISEETKHITRLLISIYHKENEIRHTQLYSSVDPQSQTVDDPTAVLALLELLVDASHIPCEFLWRVLVPLVIHVLNGLFVRSYLSLLITLLPYGANLFDQQSMLQIRGGATPLAHLLLYIKNYQGRIENTKLKQSAKQVLKSYGTLLDYRTLNPSSELRSCQKGPESKVVGNSCGYFTGFINHIIEGGDLYAASCITELTEYFTTLGEDQKPIYISSKVYQRMQSFVELLPIVIRDTEKRYLLTPSLVITSASSFFAIFIDAFLKLLQEGVAQKNIKLVPQAQKHMVHVSNLWTIVEPYVTVSQAIGAAFYDALLSLLLEYSDLRLLVDSINRFLSLFFAALITDHCKLVEYIESHFISSLYVTSAESLYSTVPSSNKSTSSNEKDCIAELERDEPSMRDSLIIDVLDLRKFVSMKQIIDLVAFQPYRFSKNSVELLHQIKFSDEAIELDVISSFLIKAHFNKYFEEQEAASSWQTLVAELSPETDRTLYMSRLDTSFESSISLTRTAPKAAQKPNVDYLKFLSEHLMLAGNPLRAIMIAGVYWAANEVTYKEICMDILQYISRSYAAVFSICFLKTFRSDAFFSTLTLLIEGATDHLSTVAAERRNAIMVLRTGVINKLMAGSTEQQKLIYNQDINDTSSNAQLIDRFYGISYTLLGSLYAAVSSYPLHDSFSIPQWRLHNDIINRASESQTSHETTTTPTVTIRNLLYQYSNMLLRVSIWTELTQFLREQDFFDQMLLVLDQFPANTHAHFIAQLRRHKSILFRHNCQFLYKRILKLACTRYRECRYTDLSVRLLVHEFIDNNLFDFAEDTQSFIIEAMFGELMVDLDGIEGKHSSIVSVSTRCSFVGSMYSALATYTFILAIIHRMLFRRPSGGPDSFSKADCWSRFYQKCLVTALSAWMLVVCSLTKLLAYNAQFIMESNGKNKVSISFLTSSLLYFAPVTDFCLCMDKHQTVAGTITELIEGTINSDIDTSSDEQKGIPGVETHVLNFLLALGLDTLIIEANEKLTEIIEGSPAILLQNQFYNICSMVIRLCDTKINLIAIEYSSMPIDVIKNHILNVIAKKLIPYSAHFDIAIRQFGVHMNRDYSLEEEALRQPVFNALIKRIFALLEAHEIYNPAYTRYIVFSTTMTNVLKYMQLEYSKKSLNTSKQCLLPHIISGSFFLIPTLEAISSLREFEYSITTDKRSPHQIDNHTECVSVLEHYYEYYSSRHAASYVTMVRHFSSKRAPLLFRMSRTKNDHGTRLILKCGEDTVADYAVMQFTEELAKCSANTFFRPYFVAVLINIPKNQISIIEHIDGNVVPIDELLSPLFMGAKTKAAEFINEQEPDENGCFPAFDLFMASVTALSHMQMALSKTHPCRFIALSQKNQRMFATTLAHWCAICIVTGLGDRHSCNILIDTDDGSVHFIDFEAVFEYPKLLSYAELVPFRLTALIAQLLGPTGIHGCFYWELVKMVSLIQENAPAFINVFYPLAIVRASLGYVRQIKEMLETQRAEEIVNAALAQAADSSRLGCMFGGWMAFL